MPRTAIAPGSQPSPIGRTPASPVYLGDGDILYHQGAAETNVYVIESGYMKLACLDTNGAGAIVGILNQDQLLGPALGGGAAAAHTASACGEVQLRCYDQVAFKRLIETHPAIAQEVVGLLAQRNDLSERRLHAVLRLDVRGRIAMILADMVGYYGQRCAHGHEVDVPLTQEELADLVGASRPVVSSTLNGLRRDGLLNYTRGHICIDDLQRLSRLGDA